MTLKRISIGFWKEVPPGNGTIYLRIISLDMTRSLDRMDVRGTRIQLGI